ncbi:MAG: hypothetical protein D6771_08615 [Zetaproteobacteria bacterium]|nr:MAG: hypothetical protein D6771_08615 [Zetaproteobacteria bacterium]
MIGKKNMAFGFFYFLTTLGLGMYLASKFSLPPEEMAKWMRSPQHGILKAAHAHGNLESVLNIVIGYLLCRLDLEAWIAKAASWLLIIGAIFHSGMLYLAGLGVGFAGKLTPIGALSIVATMLLMGIGVLKLEKVD